MTPRRSIVGLLATLGIATVGFRVAAIAIPWFVLTSSGSAVQTGLVVAAELGPYVLAKAVGGPLVDRLGQRRVSVVADVLSAGLFALIPLLHHLGALPLPVLLVIVAVAGALRGPGRRGEAHHGPAGGHRRRHPSHPGDRAAGGDRAIRGAGRSRPGGTADHRVRTARDRAGDRDLLRHQRPGGARLHPGRHRGSATARPPARPGDGARDLPGAAARGMAVPGP